MKTFLHSVLFSLVSAAALNSSAQSSAKSLLINHGSSACSSAAAEQQFFSGSLSTNPALVYAGSVGLPYGGVFSAYNPADQKVYFADISSGTGTKVYVMNYNFGGSLATPVVSAPNYTYSYVLNQLCFDNAGNNYGFKSFNPGDGKAKIEKIDITSGSTITGSTKSLQFPAGHVPNTVGDGDIVVLPNGRMFATFGNAPSMLYEFTLKADGNYNVIYLTNMPRTCFSIAFVDGNLVIAGSDGSGCYYYTWDINRSTLSNAKTYPGGKTSADMSNLTAGVGATNQITGTNMLNANTVQVFYQIVLKNKGNVYLNNVQLVEDLNQVFGVGNVTNVQVSFVSNPAGLQLNPAFNGTTNTNMLVFGQSLDNDPASTDSAVISLIVTATNLVPNKVYYNSAVATASLGSGISYLAVSDSSNNGAAARMDLDNNGVSDDPGENVPTPFAFAGGSVLPVEGLSLQGTRHDETVKLTWENNGAEHFLSYIIERSVDGVNFASVGTVNTGIKTSYLFSDYLTTAAVGVYYRIKAIKEDNTFSFSNTLHIKSNSSLGLGTYPNPFHNSLTLQLQTETKAIACLFVRDVSGRIIFSKSIQVTKGSNFITLTELQTAHPGTYFAEVISGGERGFAKVVKQ